MLCYYAVLGLEIGLLYYAVWVRDSFFLSSQCCAVLLCCIRVRDRDITFFLSSRAVLCYYAVLGLEIGLVFFPFRVINDLHSTNRVRCNYQSLHFFIIVRRHCFSTTTN